MSAEEVSAEERKTETIPQWKQEEVDNLVETLDSYESVGVVSIVGIPSRQLQAMRAELYGSAELRVSRNTLLVRALEQVSGELGELTQFVTGQVGLVGTNENPFGLFKQLEASKTPAPINAGEVAPNDIVISEGDTGVDPGPFVGELQQVGANARIDGGSIKVMEDSTVLSTGEEVSQQLANVLSELGIEPKEVGLDLRGVYADEVLFEPEELAIDIDEYRADIQSAASAGRNLSINADYPTTRTVDSMLAKAAGEAKNLGVFAAVESPDLAADLLSKANAQLRSLAVHIDDPEALPEELRDIGGDAAIEVDAEDTVSDATETNESSDNQSAEQSDADTDTSDDDDDDGDDGDALGAMFG
jgi:large subunit ribosomal protein L10